MCSRMWALRLDLREKVLLQPSTVQICTLTGFAATCGAVGMFDELFELFADGQRTAKRNPMRRNAFQTLSTCSRQSRTQTSSCREGGYDFEGIPYFAIFRYGSALCIRFRDLLIYLKIVGREQTARTIIESLADFYISFRKFVS